MRMLLNWVLSAVAVWVVAQVVPGVSCQWLESGADCGAGDWVHQRDDGMCLK